jgi:DNA invertase Pin-like site-specific DNA recombinase
LRDKASSPNSALKPAVAYLRRSTDRQDQSLPDQEAAIRRYAEANGFEILRLYTDDAISGTSADNRPGFQRLIADAGNGHCDFRTVLVYDIKRFGRVDNDEAGYYRHLLRKRGVEVVYTSEGFTGHDTDEIVRTVKQLQARQESKDLSKVTLRGQLTSVHAGSYLGGVPPYGYDYLYRDSNKKPIHVVRYSEKGEKLLLHPHTGKLMRVVVQGEHLTGSKEDQIHLVPSSPERIAVLRRIFDDYRTGFGYKSIASRLNAEGVPSPRSREWDAHFNGQWGLSTIRNILINPVYCGDTVWNRITAAKFHRSSVKGVVERRGPSGRVRDPNPREDWIVTPDTHEALIPRSIFAATHELRAKRDAAGNRSRNSRGRGYYSNYLLSGLIRCNDCDHNFMGFSHKSRACSKDPSLPRPRYYLCGGYITKGTSVCKRVAYPQEPLESYLIGRLQTRLQVFLTKGGEKVLRQMVREALAQAGPNPEKALADTRTEITRLRKDVDRLLANLTAGNRDFIDTKLGEIRRRLRDLEAKEEELQTRATQIPDLEATVEAALAQVRRLKEVLAHGSIVEQKELLRGFVGGIVLTPSQHRGVITWYDLPASLIFRGGTRAEAEKMQPWASKEAIRWAREAWTEAA